MPGLSEEELIRLRSPPREQSATRRPGSQVSLDRIASAVGHWCQGQPVRMGELDREGSAVSRGGPCLSRTEPEWEALLYRSGATRPSSSKPIELNGSRLSPLILTLIDANPNPNPN